MAFRIVLLDPAGKLQRFPATRYWKLFDHESGGRVPECAGDWARFAEAVVELVDRKPVRIVRAGFYRFKIEADGRPDANSFQEQMRLAVATLGGRQAEGNLLSHEGLWANQALRDRFQWKPTPFQARRIRRLLMGEA
jgi:hypothetical protein